MTSYGPFDLIRKDWLVKVDNMYFKVSQDAPMGTNTVVVMERPSVVWCVPREQIQKVIVVL